MKKCLLSCVLFFITICLIPVYGQSAQQVPDSVRVGLFYEGNAQNKYNLRSEAGFTIGFKENQSFTSVMQLSDSNLEVQRVSYNQFSPIKENIKTISEAIEIAQSMAIEGSDIYLYYDGSWALWTMISNNISSNTDSLIAIKGSSDYSYLLPVRRDKAVFFNSGNTISINNKRYRGILEMMPTLLGERIQVINELELEEYLYGVVPKEMPPLWPEEALRAQAVASRTYAINNLSKWQKYGFDIGAGVGDQVYGGYDAEHPKTNKAVEDTRGELILFEGQPITAFYHSDSGGVTEDSEYVFSSALPYLRSVRDLYEANSPYSRWEKSLVDISQGAPSLTREIGQIQSVDILDKSPSGRVIEVKVTGTYGEKILSNSEIRGVLNLKSNNFSTTETVETEENSLAVLSDNGIISSLDTRDYWVFTDTGIHPLGKAEVFLSGSTSPISLGSTSENRGERSNVQNIIYGRGWGHGVGMSQWGAKAMAENGYNYKDILLHYYSNVEVK